jgi:hypothetical protein
MLASSCLEPLASGHASNAQALLPVDSTNATELQSRLHVVCEQPVRHDRTETEKSVCL